jgi:hypothetical protein
MKACKGFISFRNMSVKHPSLQFDVASIGQLDDKLSKLLTISTQYQVSNTSTILINLHHYAYLMTA